jgi:hypothetical protein
LRNAAAARILHAFDGSRAMRDVVEVLRTMGPEQLFLALVFLAGYSLAIGEFATARGRLVASGAALCAAATFAALSRPWEAGLVLLGFAFVGLALFSALAWGLWRVTAARDARVIDQELAANLPRVVATSSARSRNSAPILNSPAAE